MTAIFANWQAPKNVHTVSTIRQGGFSFAPYDSFNLGDHVGDDKNAVSTNRTLLVEKFGLPQQPLFLNQIHSTKLIELPYNGDDIDADAVYTNQANQICLVMTADCLPALFCSKYGDEVAATHAGWRGLCNGILEKTVKAFHTDPANIMAWLGPAIGPSAFQVGVEVVEQFTAYDSQAAQAFVADSSQQGKFWANLYQLATQRLQAIGVTQISGGEYCTYHQKTQFFSYRRDGITGRMASLIWFE